MEAIQRFSDRSQQISVKPETVMAFFYPNLDSAFMIKSYQKDPLKIKYFTRHLEGFAQIWWANFKVDVEQSAYEHVVPLFKEAFLDAN